MVLLRPVCSVIVCARVAGTSALSCFANENPVFFFFFFLLAYGVYTSGIIDDFVELWR